MNYEQFVWVIFFTLTVVELLLLSKPAPRLIRLSTGALLILLLGIVHSEIAFQAPLIFGVTFFVVGLYRIFNIMRFSYGRMNQEYLYKSTRRTSEVIVGYQITLIALCFLLSKINYIANNYLNILTVLIGISHFYLLLVLIKNIKMYSVDLTNKVLDKDDKMLPTVTVAIPARNETSDLEECLQSIIDSDYKKLEILVFDDCSQEQASYVIKKFAHEGVRFIQGDEPGDSWLPKNAAYQKLMQEASGDIILFCGVDVRVEKDTISKLISCMVAESLQMISVLPKRSSQIQQSNVVQLTRYMWELLLPRMYLKRPPVLSTLWVIDRNKLLSLGGFLSVKRMIVPESYFARECSNKYGYKFLLVDNLGVTSLKTAAAQRTTAIRVRYPQLHRKPEMLLAVTFVLLLLFIFPYVMLIASVLTKKWVYLIAYSLVIVLQLFIYVLIVKEVISSNRLIYTLRSFAIPFIDIVIMHWSMIAYEFGEVIWKQRNVCLPVMRVIPSLPKLEDKK